MNFTDEQRKIFRYFDGAQWVFGDPLALQRRLTHALGGDPNRLLAEMGNKEIPDLANDAAERVLVAIRGVFEMVAFDKATGAGARESHCLDALDALLAHLDDQKKTAETSPCSSPPTAPAGPSPRIMEPGLG